MDETLMLPPEMTELIEAKMDELLQAEPYLEEQSDYLLLKRVQHELETDFELDLAEEEGPGPNPEGSEIVRRGKATHEAAHAVVCLLLDGTVEFVEIRPDGGGFWVGLTRSITRDPTSRACVSFAGPIATLKHDGEDTGDVVDLVEIVEDMGADGNDLDWTNICHLLGVDRVSARWPVEKVEEVLEVVGRTRDLVSDPEVWALVQNVAEKLLEASERHPRGRGLLNRAQLAELVPPHLRSLPENT